MEMNDMILISVDDHVIEPPDLFKKHLPAKYMAHAPKMVPLRDNPGATEDTWEYEGRRTPNFGLNAVVGRPPEEYGMEPASYSQIRKGTWSLKERLDDMDVSGVLASICFPTFPTFAGSLFLNPKDPEATNAVISAYNDWHIDEWCGGAPGRFIPLAILPCHDINAAVAEAKRVAAKGCRTISFYDSPTAKGLPSIHTDYWDPLWRVLEDNRIVISIHIGSGASAPPVSNDSPIDTWITSFPMYIANATTDWLFSPVFQKFPNLKLSLSEGGIGWIPYLLERADFTYKHHKAWTNANFNGMLPSDLFKRNFITCFIDDAFGLANTRFMNTDMIAWEADYPHSDALWPNAPEGLWPSIKHLPKETIDKITHLNTMREFRFDPFEFAPREACTVGALRARSTHVDTRPVANMGGHNPSNREGRPVTAGEVMKLFA
ncbi:MULTISPECIES: amidohydrolase family protein [Pandoraea]|uniref:Amidohydrolase n=2 Tax=Pandoraea TaxID=93217 RepID=A0AAW7MHF9_9BURK|nr:MULTISPECIES: amidohydrolase family protein [Pandoraea]ALS65150.1 amidohydrolase [Pandoraea apista]MDN4572096.1 amidohydrolase [Pandoraea cepalis]MDN4576752.1 amidohydrolase [Pandoraea cepalis]QHE91559.1 amidohydrolase family protein [Pandoraea fibrosis]QHF14883.1 amidohydrolase family protein [Pandoraea fibrosis]